MLASMIDRNAYKIKDVSKVKINLQNVHETLLLPLWGRAEAAAMEHPVLYDGKAKELINRIDYDYSKFRSQIRKFEVLTLAIRAKELDSIIQQFILNHPAATIVNIGAGLDTTFYRVNNGQIHWYDLDVDEVITLRKRLLPQQPKMQSIAKSMFDESFLDDIANPKDGILFFVSGVLIYFEETKVRQFFKMIASHFSGGEIAFDTMTPFGIDIASKTVKKSGIHGADMKWGISDTRQMEDWGIRCKLLEQYPIYSKTEISPSWGASTKFLMKFSDLFSMVNMNHMQFV
jgi:O-methyltransferase involved in polyketide biosynthesis